MILCSKSCKIGNKAVRPVVEVEVCFSVLGSLCWWCHSSGTAILHTSNAAHRELHHVASQCPCIRIPLWLFTLTLALQEIYDKLLGYQHRVITTECNHNSSRKYGGDADLQIHSDPCISMLDADAVWEERGACLVWKDVLYLAELLIEVGCAG